MAARHYLLKKTCWMIRVVTITTMKKCLEHLLGKAGCTVYSYIRVLLD